MTKFPFRLTRHTPLPVFLIGLIIYLAQLYLTQNKANTSMIEIQESPASAIATKSGELVEAGVLRIVDGDTIELTSGQKVRYIGINTPESVDPRRPVQCFGKEAAEKNRILVESKTVRLEKDVSETDKYGRLLRYVYVGDQMVNELLVREGFAQIDTYPPDIKYVDKFKQDQILARSEGKGMWSGCPEPSSSAILEKNR
jgi:micrococcal nuclease